MLFEEVRCVLFLVIWSGIEEVEETGLVVECLLMLLEEGGLLFFQKGVSGVVTLLDFV